MSQAIFEKTMSSEPTQSDQPVKHRAIVAGHGEFAAGLVSAVVLISGRGNQLIPIAVHKLGVADIVALVRVRMIAADVRVIFTDLQAGSCTMASRRILRGMDDAVLIAGANLPTLLDFVFAEGMSAPQAARHAAERGRAAIAVHGAGA
jgi:PTS system N-acetylgalactosamine-specific IIA component